jgi:hypothetical protein
MKRLKKLLFVILVLILVSQIPFAYRRYQLRGLSKAIQQINSTRRPLDTPGFTEYKGVMHVHSSLGGHSRGSLADIVAAAQTNQLQFVVMTEHTEREIDTAEQTLKGVQAGVLFVNGNELRTKDGDRLLVLPGDKSLSLAGQQSTLEVAASSQSRGSLSIVAYPAEFKGWQADSFDAVEVYNTFTNASRVNPVLTFFDVLWSQRSYPDLLFATFYERPNEGLRLWDESLKSKRVTGVAGNDAHANIGVSLDDRSGESITGITLDPYETSFRLVRLHVLIPNSAPLDMQSLLEAIKLGHCFIAFDLFGDSSGFSFVAEGAGKTAIQGDEIQRTSETRLIVRSPVTSRIRLLRDGIVISEEIGLEKQFPVTTPGVYRVEAYLPQLGMVGDQPWIISNPIYVR